MNIYTMTEDFHEDFAEMFKKYGEVKILPRGLHGIGEIDLLIATGGEDVGPAWYGSKRKTSKNDARDNREMSLMSYVYEKAISVKKVLGVCRGLQMMNVFFGGSLVFDLRETFGRSHGIAHKLLWIEPNVFASTLAVVNSLHHQCVDAKAVGKKLPYKILALEPETGAIESVLWADKYFGVQWHPEFMNGESEPMKRFFAEKIIDWVNGGKLMDNPPPEKGTMKDLQEGLKGKKTVNWDISFVDSLQENSALNIATHSDWFSSSPIPTSELDEESDEELQLENNNEDDEEYS